MKKYFCEYCKVNLFYQNLKGRLMHFKGVKHNLNKKTYFLEELAKEDNLKYLTYVYKQNNIKKND